MRGPGNKRKRRYDITEGIGVRKLFERKGLRGSNPFKVIIKAICVKGLI